MPDFTQNGYFAIDSGKLYVHGLHIVPVRYHSLDVGDTKSLTPLGGTAATYYRLKPDGKFFKDCLYSAEDLVTDVYPSSATDMNRVRTRVAATRVDFGNSNTENIDAAEGVSSAYANKNAAPDVGQAYVIVSTYRSGGALYPYHAAGVIAKDGNDRVTLEVFASSTDAASRTVDGTYKIYSVSSGSGRTFHDVWGGNPVFRTGAATKEPITIVIEKKP